MSLVHAVPRYGKSGCFLKSLLPASRNGGIPPALMVDAPMYNAILQQQSRSRSGLALSAEAILNMPTASAKWAVERAGQARDKAMLEAAMAHSAVHSAVREGARRTLALPFQLQDAATKRYKMMGGTANKYWQNYKSEILVGAGATTTLLLWRALSGVGWLVGWHGLQAEMQSMGLAACTTAAVALGLRLRYSVDTNQVIKLAHEKVLEDVGVREVLGPPVRKTNCFASITTGSTIGMRDMTPVWRSARVHAVFEVMGSERVGLVAVRAKKYQGVYQLELLSIECPAERDGSHRIFLVGSQSIYEQEGVLETLKAPLGAALDSSSYFEAKDDLQALKRATS
mmetsp:Transcript_39999/g.76501  ORF Transcript_39999/g.76501 Transcript_39999/m.76501 type:complete len:341 (-) Transcript_39999:177-1199(-)